MKLLITSERLKEVLGYDPETGVFTWLCNKGGSAREGSEAGKLTKLGYCQISVDRRMYYGHRLAFLFMTGKWPPVEVDHINHVRVDNRWSNLRLATRIENKMNRLMQRNNTSGVKGVSWAGGKWNAAIRHQGKTKHLGRFDSLADATEFVQLARDMCHEEFACHA